MKITMKQIFLAFTILSSIGSIQATKEPQTPCGKSLSNTFAGKMDKLKTEDNTQWYFKNLDDLASYLKLYELESATDGNNTVLEVKNAVADQVKNRLRTYIPLPKNYNTKDRNTYLTEDDLNICKKTAKEEFERDQDTKWCIHPISNQFTILPAYDKQKVLDEIAKLEQLSPVQKKDTDKGSSKKDTSTLFKKLVWGSVGAGIVWYLYSQWNSSDDALEAPPVA